MRSQLLSCRSGKLTPSQVAKNIIAVLEDCDKSTPPLRAIVQWDQEQIMLVMPVGKGASATTRAVERVEVLLICYTEKYVHFCFYLVQRITESLLPFLQKEAALRQFVSYWTTIFLFLNQNFCAHVASVSMDASRQHFPTSIQWKKITYIVWLVSNLTKLFVVSVIKLVMSCSSTLSYMFSSSV